MTLATAHWERKVSQVTRGLRVVPAALVSPASATSEHPAFAESLETLEYRGCQGHQVYLDREVSDDMCVCVCVCVRACVFDFVRQSLKESVCVCVCVDVVFSSQVNLPDHTSIPSSDQSHPPSTVVTIATSS